MTHPTSGLVPGRRPHRVLDIATGELSDHGEGYAPKWSPDGSRLAYVGGSDDVVDIYSMDADGTDITQLTHDAAFDTFPIWSPDGETILFLSATEQ